MTAVLTRSWQDVARTIWPDAQWVASEGPFATVSGCGSGTTVLLHPTAEKARGALRNMHPGGVGGPCMQKHVLIELARPTDG
jgi:hypothetical protein